MIKIGNNVQILETSLCPWPAYCDKVTAEKFITDMQYHDFLMQETRRIEEEINLLCMGIEKQISYF